LKAEWFGKRIPLHRDESIRPFFIIGSGRSGNTLLRRLILSRSLTYVPPETYVLGDVIRSFRRNRRLSWEDVVCLTLGHFEYCPEFKEFGIESLREFSTRAVNIAPEKRSLALLLDELYRYFGERSGVEFVCWGDKTPYNTFSLDHIAAVFPQAKFIYMQRDGCDVVPSYVHAGLYANVEEAARRWVVSNRLALKFQKRNPDKVMAVKYEEMVSRSEEMSENVVRFLDLPARPETDESELIKKMGDVHSIEHLKRVAMPVDSSSIGKGRRQLTAEQRDSLAPIMDKMLLQMGYERCLRQD